MSRTSAILSVNEIIKQNKILHLVDNLNGHMDDGTLNREIFDKYNKDIREAISSMSVEYKDMNKNIYGKIIQSLDNIEKDLIKWEKKNEK